VLCRLLAGFKGRFAAGEKIKGKGERKENELWGGERGGKEGKKRIEETCSVTAGV